MKPPRIFLIGTGVGRDLRGFESHIRDLFEHVKNVTDYDAYIVKGSNGRSRQEIVVPNIGRKSRLAKFVGFITRRNSSVVAQLSFLIGLIPTLYRLKPIALYLGEPVLFNYLYRWREFSGMNFRMVFYTGGNTVPLRMRPNDLLQLVTPVLIPLAEHRGIKSSQMKVIPHFINSSGDTEYSVSKHELRKKLQIPPDRLIILSVGAIDSSIKRMDYLIEEVSNLSVPYYLIILGEFESETPVIKNLAEQNLGNGNFFINRVNRNELKVFYQAADVFVLTSLNEGFALVTIEAMAEGLPVIVHDHDVVRYVLSEMGSYTNLTKTGNLTNAIEVTAKSANDCEAVAKRKKYVANRFSWNVLEKDYLQLLKEATNSPN